MSVTTSTVKRTTRVKKTASRESEESSAAVSPSLKTNKALEDGFVSLVTAISSAKDEYIILKRQIEEVKEEWIKEQRLHELQLQERDQQEEIARRRSQELYDYEITLKRRQEEDQFSDKKQKWEKDLQVRKDEIEQEKKELEELRRQVAQFETEKQKAAKEACLQLQKELTDGFSHEKNLAEQDFKREKEILTLRVEMLTNENARQIQEIEALKKALDEATKQLKDVAVKIIESSNPSKSPSPQE